MTANLFPSEVDRRLGEVLATHFDPQGGTPYWLARARRLGFDPRERIRTVADLPLLGLIKPEELHGQPLEHFLPRSLWDQKPALVVAQTGGTLGKPVWTAYGEEEFRDGFVKPFVVAARHVGFPSGGAWLYAGPGGPHIIARAAEAIARATGSMTPFTVDFDSRWARKLPPSSFAADRYLQHIVQQARDVIQSQPITTIFTTQVVLEALAGILSEDERSRVRGVHYGGMAIERDKMARFQAEFFPHAVHLSGYGNTLFGCCLELAVSVGRTLRYYPFGCRLVFGVLTKDGTNREAVCYDRGKVDQGQLVVTRLDHTMFLANVVERDRVRLIEPPCDGPEGFVVSGVESPSPVVKEEDGSSIALY